MTDYNDAKIVFSDVRRAEGFEYLVDVHAYYDKDSTTYDTVGDVDQVVSVFTFGARDDTISQYIGNIQGARLLMRGPTAVGVFFRISTPNYRVLNLNRVARVTVGGEVGGDVLNFVEKTVLYQTGTDSYASLTGAAFTRFVSASGNVVFNPEVSDVLTLITSWDLTLFPAWIRELPDIDNIQGLTLPYRITSNSLMLSFSGTPDGGTRTRMRIAFGNPANAETQIEVDVSVVNNLPDDTPTVAPAPPPTISVAADNFGLNSDDTVSADWSTLPEIPIANVDTVESQYQRLLPARGGIGRRTYSIQKPPRIIFTRMADGETWRLRVRLVTTSGVTVYSLWQTLTRRGQTLLIDPLRVQREYLEASKLYLRELNDTSMTWELVSTGLLGDSVESIKAVLTAGGETTEVVFTDIGGSESLLMPLTGLTPLTTYSIEWRAIVAGEEMPFLTSAMRTIPAIPDNPTEEQRAEIYRQRVIRMSHDFEDADYIFNLGAPEIATIMCNDIDRMNNPDNDGRVHDFNRQNKFGNRYTRNIKESTVDNFSDGLLQIFERGADAVPEIDSDFNFLEVV